MEKEDILLIGLRDGVETGIDVKTYVPDMFNLFPIVELVFVSTEDSSDIDNVITVEGTVLDVSTDTAKVLFVPIVVMAPTELWFPVRRGVNVAEIGKEGVIDITLIVAGEKANVEFLAFVSDKA